MGERFVLAERATAQLFSKGIKVFSPVVYCHRLAIVYELPKDYSFWRSFNQTWIDWATEFMTLMLDGWKESKGRAAEMYYALEEDKELSYASIKGDQLTIMIEPIE